MMDNTHAHITTWVIALILFLIALALHKNAGKGFKMTHMLLRLFYILIIITGALLFFKHQTIDSALYGMKFLLGLIVISMFEMVLVRLSKGKRAIVPSIILIISFILTLYLGLYLPLGFKLF